MAIDVSRFFLHNVIDSCSIWNLLASRLLFATSLAAGCSYVCCEYVLYECLDKPRQIIQSGDEEIKRLLREGLMAGRLSRQSLSLEDLQDANVLSARKRVGRGELASIVLARRLRVAFMTDDQPARKFAASEAGSTVVQTVPHLLGWLVFEGRLNDGDKATVSSEHAALRPGKKSSLTKYFDEAYELAMLFRLNRAPPAQG